VSTFVGNCVLRKGTIPLCEARLVLAAGDRSARAEVVVHNGERPGAGDPRAESRERGPHFLHAQSW